MQSDLDILCLLTYTTISNDSVRGQRRPRSVCMNVQVEPGPHCPQITKGPFCALGINYENIVINIKKLSTMIFVQFGAVSHKHVLSYKAYSELF